MLFQLHRLSCIISKISGVGGGGVGGNCASSLARLGVGLGQHIIQDERVVRTVADKRWARCPGAQPRLSDLGRGGGRGPSMCKTHLEQKQRTRYFF